MNETEAELRAEIQRLKDVNVELSETKRVQVLRFEVSAASVPGSPMGVKVLATCSLGDEFGAAALQMVALCMAQIGGTVAAAGMTPSPEASAS